MPKSMTNTQIVFLGLTFFTWFVLTGVLKSVVGVDTTGDRDIFAGLRWILAYLLVPVCWYCIVALFFSLAAQRVLPSWIGYAAILLLPASCVAAWIAIYLLEYSPERWPFVIPVGVPLLLALYIVALLQPSLRGFAASLPVNLAIVAVLLWLSVSVWPVLGRLNRTRDTLRVDAERIRVEAAAKAEEQKHNENLEKIRNMSPNVHIAEWFSLLADESGVRQEAIEAVKKVPRRQGDVVDCLQSGIPAVMRLVPDLDLEYTPELCAAAHAYFEKNARQMELGTRAPQPYERQWAVEFAGPGVRWFHAHGCDCGQGIAALEKVIQTYLDSPDRRKALAELEELKASAR